MDIDKIIIVLMVASLALLFPIFQSPTQIELLPDETKTILLDVQQPDLLIRVRGGHANISISKLIGSYTVDLIDINNYELKGLNTGLYSIEISSTSLVSIILDGSGIYSQTYIVMGVLAVMTIWVVNKRIQKI